MRWRNIYSIKLNRTDWCHIKKCAACWLSPLYWAFLAYTYLRWIRQWKQEVLCKSWRHYLQKTSVSLFQVYLWEKLANHLNRGWIRGKGDLRMKVPIRKSSRWWRLQWAFLKTFADPSRAFPGAGWELLRHSSLDVWGYERKGWKWLTPSFTPTLAQLETHLIETQNRIPTET